MAVQPADMNSCNIKNTCVGGVNDGVAYDPENPCTEGFIFDSFACDCILDSNFIGAWGYDDKNDIRTASSLVVDISPYYDVDGKLVTYTAGVSELPCGSASAFETNPCGQVPQYSGAVDITKTAPCFGLGQVGLQYVFTYRDGVLDNLIFMNVAVSLSCFNTLDDFNSGSVGWFYGDTIQEVQDQLDNWVAGSGPPSP